MAIDAATTRIRNPSFGTAKASDILEKVAAPKLLSINHYLCDELHQREYDFPERYKFAEGKYSFIYKYVTQVCISRPMSVAK